MFCCCYSICNLKDQYKFELRRKNTNTKRSLFHLKSTSLHFFLKKFVIEAWLLPPAFPPAGVTFFFLGEAFVAFGAFTTGSGLAFFLLSSAALVGARTDEAVDLESSSSENEIFVE